jgi:geranylgeranyl transferase type-2 subunit beta
LQIEKCKLSESHPLLLTLVFNLQFALFIFAILNLFRLPRDLPSPLQYSPSPRRCLLRMSREPYLPRLNARLADGLVRLPQADRARHVAYLRSVQNADGGFSGRQGGSDLYYTGFALRGLSALDALSPEVCTRAAGFLRASLAREAGVADFFSLLYSCLLVQAASGDDPLAQAPPDWPDRVAAVLEGFRTADGGYAKTQGGVSGSTYHTFLVALCYELLGRSLPEPGAAVRFVASRRRDDGGFVEIAPMRRGGTNPTAAAVGLLKLTEPHSEALLAEVRPGVVDFLADLDGMEGGLRANTRAPLADLLSTFTASWTLAELETLDRLDGAGLAGYARAVERAEGGFRGGLWDEGFDVEYTFYGLGVLGLFS